MVHRVENSALVLLRRIHEVSDSYGTASVFCAQAGKAVALEHCRGCTACRGLFIDVTERSTFLRCAYEPAEGQRERSAGVSAEVEIRAYGQEPVSTIMASPLRTVRSDASLLSLASLFIESNISAAPVVDENGRPIGLVSKSDLVRRFYERGGSMEALNSPLSTQPPSVTDTNRGALVDDDGVVADIMTPLLIAVGQDVPVAQAAALMAYEGVHHLIVHDADGAPLGIVSALDFLRQFARSEGFLGPATADPSKGSAEGKEGGT